MERLSQAILRQGDNWHPFKVAKNGPALSHIFFGADLMLFSEASPAQARLMNLVLEDFCVVLGHKMSGSKSSIYFSTNTPISVKQEVSSILGFQVVDSMGKYLGVPIVHGKIKKTMYNDIMARMKDNVNF